ncbi:MAG: polysaccharide deacetylase family protein [Alphaproteobacteria bacterium]|nr:polysaccharide deacetylase family protein [Alphaproteobacteria bacterium]
MKRGAITVDVDPVPGLDPWDTAVPRILDLLGAVDVRATFFVTGSLVDGPRAGRVLRDAVARGHEVASHSHTHPGGFGALDAARQAEELDTAAATLADATGAPVVGFRAPAWDAGVVTLQLLAERGYRYDSSACPTWLAPLGRAAARWFRRPVRPFGPAAWQRAPLAPYHVDPDAPWRAGGGALVEVPVGVTWGRLPAWSTPTALVPGPVRAAVRRGWLAGPAPVWLLHAHDVVDVPRPWSMPPVDARVAMIVAWLRAARDALALQTVRELADAC